MAGSGGCGGGGGGGFGGVVHASSSQKWVGASPQEAHGEDVGDLQGCEQHRLVVLVVFPRLSLGVVVSCRRRLFQISRP